MKKYQTEKNLKNRSFSDFAAKLFKTFLRSIGNYTENFSLISAKLSGVVYGMTDTHKENRQLLYRCQEDQQKQEQSLL